METILSMISESIKFLFMKIMEYSLVVLAAYGVYSIYTDESLKSQLVDKAESVKKSVKDTIKKDVTDVTSDAMEIIKE